jgi:glycine/D-amino acid oxidase-like deaminating enzyme
MSNYTVVIPSATPGAAAGSPPYAIYLVGGGIASMAAAVFLIRDGDVIGRNITILEESDVDRRQPRRLRLRREGLRAPGRPHAREQIRLHFRTVSSIPDARREARPSRRRYLGVERDHEDLVEVSLDDRRSPQDAPKRSV